MAKAYLLCRAAHELKLDGLTDTIPYDSVFGLYEDWISDLGLYESIEEAKKHPRYMETADVSYYECGKHPVIRSEYTYIEAVEIDDDAEIIDGYGLEVWSSSPSEIHGRSTGVYVLKGDEYKFVWSESLDPDCE